MIELAPEEYRKMSAAARAKAEAEFSLLHEVSAIVGWMTDDGIGEARRHEGTEARRENAGGPAVA